MRSHGETATVLTRSESLDLLRTARVGRVVYTHGALPAITPVYFLLDGDHVLLRTEPQSRLARSLNGSVVAFQVDCIDEVRAGGWSVIITGMAELLSGSALERARALPMLTWPGDERSQYIRITPSVVTGRMSAPRLSV
jgi:nitroimidazol reductase NimA-like FMN-containing flavoprotein (pyridoxamine 5'-phosphate oxidase superfamily)